MVAKSPNGHGFVTIAPTVNTRAPLPSEVRWGPPPGRLLRCEVRLTPEPDEGGFSVYAAELPGVVSEGESELEAIRNIAEAIQGALAEYLKDLGHIPWKRDCEPQADNEMRRWIVVNV